MLRSSLLTAVHVPRFSGLREPHCPPWAGSLNLGISVTWLWSG